METVIDVGSESDRTAAFLQGQHDYYGAYHHHKESIADHVRHELIDGAYLCSLMP